MSKDLHIWETYESEIMDEVERNFESFDEELNEGMSIQEDTVLKRGKKRSFLYWTFVLIVIGVISFLFFSQSGQISAGIEAYEEGRFEEAVHIFEDILNHKPKMRNKIAPHYSRALLGHASTLMDRDPERAKSLLQRSVKLNPKNIQSHFNMGLLYVRLKDYPHAIRSFRAVMKLNPRHPDALFNLGYVYAVTKNYPRAERVYGRVVSLNPSYLDEALFNLAMVQKNQGKTDVCIKNLEKVLNVNPYNELAYRYLYRLKK
ncbi:MAG: tetratricopeptide repeat protein [Thermodesulfobacteriota bacterium]|nr:tetratricopeptide repeat protein [Thermodesulfobacteriota bacterium]